MFIPSPTPKGPDCCHPANVYGPIQSLCTARNTPLLNIGEAFPRGKCNAMNKRAHKENLQIMHVCMHQADMRACTHGQRLNNCTMAECLLRAQKL